MRTVGQRLVEGLAARGWRSSSASPACIRSSCTGALPGRASAMSPRGTNRARGSWPMAMRGFGQAGRRLCHHRAGGDEHPDRDGAGAGGLVPMLVVSGVNRLATLGRGWGICTNCRTSGHWWRRWRCIGAGGDAGGSGPGARPRLCRDAGRAARPGASGGAAGRDAAALRCAARAGAIPAPPDPEVARAAVLLAGARAPLILAGGGARAQAGAAGAGRAAGRAGGADGERARADARHPLAVPASPSLQAVRDLISGADRVLAVGTELGPTDFDIYQRGGVPDLSGMIRIDIDAAQLDRHPAALTIRAEAGTALAALAARLPARSGDGAARAEGRAAGAWDELDAGAQADVALIGAIRDALPGAVVVGDSTRMVYAGNLFWTTTAPAAGSTRPPALARWATASARRSARRLPIRARRSSVWWATAGCSSRRAR
jgi:acetolactate synthase I/II/III large subunit